MQQRRLLSRLVLPSPNGNDGSKQAHRNRLKSRRLICEEMANISAFFPPHLFLPGKKKKKPKPKQLHKDAAISKQILKHF